MEYIFIGAILCIVVFYAVIRLSLVFDAMRRNRFEKLNDKKE